jgi:hypothetical protein
LPPPPPQVAMAASDVPGSPAVSMLGSLSPGLKSFLPPSGI